MNRKPQPGNLGTGGPRGWRVWLPFGLFLLATAGCNTPKSHSGDPLFGEYYPKGPNGQPMPPPSQGAKTTSAAPGSGVPAYPANNSASSTASIAANSNLPGGRSLAINETQPPNWTLTNTSNSNGPRPSAGPVVQPIPRETPGPGQVNAGNNGIIRTGSWSNNQQGNPVPPMGATTPEVLQGTLQARGAVGLKQENVPEGVRVSCFVPSPANRANFRYLETTGRDSVTALQALLVQIDQQR